MTTGYEAVKETIDLYRDGKDVIHDSHPHEPCDYLFHTGKNVGLVGSRYQEKVKISFPFTAQGASGTATVTAQANFKITNGFTSESRSSAAYSSTLDLELS